jgi:hypothetical protein
MPDALPQVHYQCLLPTSDLFTTAFGKDTQLFFYTSLGKSGEIIANYRYQNPDDNSTVFQGTIVLNDDGVSNIIWNTTNSALHHSSFPLSSNIARATALSALYDIMSHTGTIKEKHRPTKHTNESDASDDTPHPSPVLMPTFLIQYGSSKAQTDGPSHDEELLIEYKGVQSVSGHIRQLPGSRELLAAYDAYRNAVASGEDPETLTTLLNTFDTLYRRTKKARPETVARAPATMQSQLAASRITHPVTREISTLFTYVSPFARRSRRNSQQPRRPVAPQLATNSLLLLMNPKSN